MVDAFGEFLLIVGHHDEGLVRTLAEGLYDVLDEAAVGEVKTVEGFIEDEEVGVLDEGTGEEYEALLTTRQFQEGAVGEVTDTEDVHPEETLVKL